MVMVTRVPPVSVSSSSIRVVHVSGVSTRRVVTSRRGFQSTISPCGAPGCGRPAVEPARGAHERRPDAGGAGAVPDHVGDVADGAVGLEHGQGAPDLGAAPRGTSRTPLQVVSADHQRLPTETSNSTWLTSGRSRE